MQLILLDYLLIKLHNLLVTTLRNHDNSVYSSIVREFLEWVS